MQILSPLVESKRIGQEIGKRQSKHFESSWKPMLAFKGGAT